MVGKIPLFGNVFVARMRLLRAWAAALLLIGGHAFASGLGPLLDGYIPGGGEDRSWSVFVGKDFETGGTVAELEGRAFIRGDFIAGKPNYVVGRAGGGSGVFPPADIPTLVVGGSIRGTGGINLPGRPPIQVGSTIASTVSFIDRGVVITGGVDYAAADAQLADLRAKSRFWGDLPDTAGGQVKRQWGGVHISADGVNGNPKTWVFTLDADVTAPTWGFSFSGFEEGDSILVNCKKKGGNATFVVQVNAVVIEGMNHNSPFAPKLLWNFPDARSVTLSGHAAFQGSVLVGNPESVTTVSVPGHDGRFITCGKLIHHGTLGCEFHNYPFTGSLPELPTYAISGNVKMDADRTRSFTDPDMPVGGALVALYTDPDGDGDPSDGERVQTVETDSNGAYRFNQVRAGTYVVVKLAHSHEIADVIPVAVTDGDSTENNILVEIDPSGFFYDSSDGRIITGGSITVFGEGAVVKMDGTLGEYMFISTNPVTTVFTMALTPPPGYIIDPSRPPQAGVFDPTGYSDPFFMGSGLAVENGDYLADWSAASNPYYLGFELSAGDPFILNNNIPLVKTVTLGGRVWEDLDGDGVQDAGEPSMPAVTIHLLDASEAVVASTVADANGAYRFSDLLPATYQVAFVAPSGYRFAPQHATTDDTKDSDARPGDGRTGANVYAAGATALEIDAGLVYATTPLSAALDVDFFATASGVVIELWTTDEEGLGDVVVYAKVRGEWVEAGRLRTDDMVGSGSNRYEIRAEGLEIGGAYHLMVIDEVGNVHFSGAPVPVRAMRMGAMRLGRDVVTLSFGVEPGRRYVIESSSDLRTWTTEPASRQAGGAWSAYSLAPFAVQGRTVEVRVPKNGRSRAYFRFKLVE